MRPPAGAVAIGFVSGVAAAAVFVAVGMNFWIANMVGFILGVGVAGSVAGGGR
jgi:hypothetical protein